MFCALCTVYISTFVWLRFFRFFLHCFTHSAVDDMYILGWIQTPTWNVGQHDRAWPTAVSDFTQQLATIEEQHGEQLQQLVETFRIRNAELRKERYLFIYVILHHRHISAIVILSLKDDSRPYIIVLPLNYKRDAEQQLLFLYVYR